MIVTNIQLANEAKFQLWRANQLGEILFSVAPGIGRRREKGRVTEHDSRRARDFASRKLQQLIERE
jgi:hypothetical protein